jgi:hypothetical protein
VEISREGIFGLATMSPSKTSNEAVACYAPGKGIDHKSVNDSGVLEAIFGGWCGCLPPMGIAVSSGCGGESRLTAGTKVENGANHIRASRLFEMAILWTYR